MVSLCENGAAEALAALGNRTRLRLFRLLVKAGPDGLNVGELQKRLAVPASTLAHHISALERSGLVRQDKRGREVVNRADFDAVRALSAFLIEACCQGFEDESQTDVA